MYSDDSKSCEERIQKIGCTQDSQCRSALQNMYGCDDMKTCPTQDIPYAGGLAWTSAGTRAIQCLCGQDAHCDIHDTSCKKKAVGTCRIGRRRGGCTREIEEEYEEAGVLESSGMMQLYIN